jgi:hypothetical protein
MLNWLKGGSAQVDNALPASTNDLEPPGDTPTPHQDVDSESNTSSDDEEGDFTFPQTKCTSLPY